MSYATQELFDVPGPRGRRRSNIAGFITIAIVVAFLGFIVFQLYRSGQFEAQKWQLFTFPMVQQEILKTTVSTMNAFLAGAVLALVLGVLLLLGRLSQIKWVTVAFSWLTETFRAIPLLILMMLRFENWVKKKLPSCMAISLRCMKRSPVKILTSLQCVSTQPCITPWADFG